MSISDLGSAMVFEVIYLCNTKSRFASKIRFHKIASLFRLF